MPHRLLHDDMKESGLLPVTGRLLKSFNFAYQPRSHAVDLVLALHVILRMLDRLNTSGMQHRLNISGTSCYAAPQLCHMHTCKPDSPHMRREHILLHVLAP